MKIKVAKGTNHLREPYTLMTFKKIPFQTGEGKFECDSICVTNNLYHTELCICDDDLVISVISVPNELIDVVMESLCVVSKDVT